MNSNQPLRLCGELIPGYSGDYSITAHRIHKYPKKLSPSHWTYPMLSELGWIERLSMTKRDADSILKLVFKNTNSCKDINNNLIDRHIVHKELQILAKDIISIINLAFARLLTKPELDVDANQRLGLNTIRGQCQILKSQARHMIFKSVKHDIENQVKLLFLASQSDLNSPLNQIPKELINLFATIIFEDKYGKAKKDCGLI